MDSHAYEGILRIRARCCVRVQVNHDLTYKIPFSLSLVRTLTHMTGQQLLDLHETVEACPRAGGTPRMCRDNAWRSYRSQFDHQSTRRAKSTYVLRWEGI